MKDSQNSRRPILIFLLALSVMALWGTHTHAQSLSISWKSDGLQKSLKPWDFQTESTTLKAHSRRELEKSWKGVLFSEFFNQATSGIPLAEKAKIDLLVLKDDKGESRVVPRAFIQKYPALLAKSTQEKNPQALSFVVPYSTHGKQLVLEMVPYQGFNFSNISSVEFTNFRQLYGSEVFLKRRSDPVLLLGEKRFVHTCMGCHYSPKNPSLTFARKVGATELVKEKHKGMEGFPALTPTDHKALTDFLREIQTQSRAIAQSEGSSS